MASYLVFADDKGNSYTWRIPKRRIRPEDVGELLLQYAGAEVYVLVEVRKSSEAVQKGKLQTAKDPLKLQQSTGLAIGVSIQ